jgi:hypothetical protein
VTRKGTLGTVEIVLPEWLDPEERYSRAFKPITPASREVSGDDDQIAPETDIANWSINDWSAGEGDLRWKDRGRYNISTGNGPVSDGSGVTVGHDFAVTSKQSAVITRGGGRLVSARDMDDNLYFWNGSAFASAWAIGGTGGEDCISLAATEPTAWFVLADDGDIRKVTTGGNTAHYTGGLFTDLVSYDGVLYGLVGADLYSIDQSSADTRTAVFDDLASAIITDTRVKLLSTSDVGPIWCVPTDDGNTLFMEYNVADGTGYVSHNLPRDTYVYDVAFHDGFYFAGFRYASSSSSIGEAYLFFKKGDQRGTTGPFRAIETTSSKRVAIAGVIGDRIMLIFQERVWAYDLSSGGIVLVADLSASAITDVLNAVTFGSEVFLAAVGNFGKVNTRAFLANVAQVLSTGLHDYRYLGLPKMIHTVTINTEAVLAASDKVEVGYSLDGGSITYLADDFAAATASHQWTVSTNASSVKGTEIEWHIRQTTTSTSVAAKVVSLASDVSGAKSRIQFTVAVDLGQSSVNDGSSVAAALGALKTSHAVVKWSDPFDVEEHVADETFDVRVLDVLLQEISGPEHTFAIVRMQTVGVVG